MSVELVTAYKGFQFYCTTSDRAFGPTMPSVEVSERFASFLGKDPRKFTLAELDKKWEEFRTGELTMSYKIPSGWNLPPGVSDNDPYFNPPNVNEGESDEPCNFCGSHDHDTASCPQADESVDEHLHED